jgi:hypothetical protein
LKLNIKDQNEPVVSSAPTVLAPSSGFLSFDKDDRGTTDIQPKGMSLSSNKTKAFAGLDGLLVSPSMSQSSSASNLNLPRKNSIPLSNSFATPTVNYPTIGAPPKFQNINTSFPTIQSPVFNKGPSQSNTGFSPGVSSLQPKKQPEDWGSGWDDMEPATHNLNMSLLSPQNSSASKTVLPGASLPSWSVMNSTTANANNSQTKKSNDDWGAW